MPRWGRSRRTYAFGASGVSGLASAGFLAKSGRRLQVARRRGDRLGEGEALNAAGFALCAMRRFEEAIAASQQAVVIFRETGDRADEGAALTIMCRSLVARER
jgi:glycine/D-amino acid oxidase-like deaminating enzyme